MFAKRTAWNLAANRYSTSLEEYRQSAKKLLDLTASNPTTIGLRYREDMLLGSLSRPQALTYEPNARGLLASREAIAGYYAEHNASVPPDDLILTTSTSEGYSFIFRLLCDPGDTVLVPSPSYPLFDFLADLHDVKLVPYELVYDYGWQIDFTSLENAVEDSRQNGSPGRAVLLVHPNNPTGSFVKPHEAAELNRMCAANEMAIIADEVFLDYRIAADAAAETFAGDYASAPQNGRKAGQASNAVEVFKAAVFVNNQKQFSGCQAVTFVLSGLSKISALPQMKVAWIAVSGPPNLKREALNRLEVIADTYLTMNAPVEFSIPTLLDERRSIQPQMMTRIRHNLAELDAQLSRQSLCRRLEVEGGWYAVLRVPVIGTDEDFAIALLAQSGVLVHPGHFYDFASEGYFVISLITPQADFAEGVQRLLDFVAKR